MLTSQNFYLHAVLELKMARRLKGKNADYSSAHVKTRQTRSSISQGTSSKFYLCLCPSGHLPLQRKQNLLPLLPHRMPAAAAAKGLTLPKTCQMTGVLLF
jgi:hypothetical protein